MSTTTGPDSMLNEDPKILASELVKRMYYRPDYRRLLEQSSERLLRELANDPEAVKAMRRLLQKYGITVEESSERLALLTIGLIAGGIFVAGAVVGYFAEGKKQSPKK